MVIAASLGVSVAVFTLLLKASTALLRIPSDTWAWVSGGILITLGLVSVFPAVWDRVSAGFALQGRSNGLLGRSRTTGGLAGPILTGAALGPVFSSCSPFYAYLIATVLPASAGQGILLLGAYVIGLSGTLLAISLLGQRAVKKLRWTADPHGWFRRTIGVLFILVGLLVLTGTDKDIQTWLVEHNPLESITVFDEQFIPDEAGSAVSAPLGKAAAGGAILAGLAAARDSTAAPEFEDLTGWTNGTARSLADLRGQVVLLDFWTAGCINCRNVAPQVQFWWKHHGDAGLAVVGVHAPEFAALRDPARVATEVADLGLTYPVALDNEFATWNAYGVRAWPTLVLIDRQGRLRYSHIGEGAYDTTEQAIVALLTERV